MPTTATLVTGPHLPLRARNHATWVQSLEGKHPAVTCRRGPWQETRLPDCRPSRPDSLFPPLLRTTVKIQRPTPLLLAASLPLPLLWDFLRTWWSLSGQSGVGRAGPGGRKLPVFSRNRGLPPLLSNWARGGPRGLLVTDIWGPAHRPNLDRVLLCWGGLRGDSRGPSYVTILYVALHLTQLLPDLKQGGWVCANTQPDTRPPCHAHPYI